MTIPLLHMTLEHFLSLVGMSILISCAIYGAWSFFERRSVEWEREGHIVEDLLNTKVCPTCYQPRQQKDPFAMV